MKKIIIIAVLIVFICIFLFTAIYIINNNQNDIDLDLLDNKSSGFVVGNIKSINKNNISITIYDGEEDEYDKEFSLNKQSIFYVLSEKKKDLNKFKEEWNIYEKEYRLGNMDISQMPEEYELINVSLNKVSVNSQVKIYYSEVDKQNLIKKLIIIHDKDLIEMDNNYIQDEVFNFSGNIILVGVKEIRVNTSFITEKERNVKIDDQTEIIELVIKDQKLFESEYQLFKDSLDTKDPLSLPERYIEKKVDFSFLQNGQNVNIESSQSGDDYLAKKIEIIKK